MSEDTNILLLSLKLLSDAFDRLIGSCMDEHEKPQAPTYKALMQARGYLPPHCKNTLVKK